MRHEPRTLLDVNPACDPTEMSSCARCGRDVLPAQLVDVSDVPADVFDGVGLACDGCRATAVLTGAIAMPSFVHYTGGDAAAVDRAAAKEAAEIAAGNLPDPDPRSLLPDLSV